MLVTVHRATEPGTGEPVEEATLRVTGTTLDSTTHPTFTALEDASTIVDFLFQYVPQATMDRVVAGCLHRLASRLTEPYEVSPCE